MAFSPRVRRAPAVAADRAAAAGRRRAQGYWQRIATVMPQFGWMNWRATTV